MQYFSNVEVAKLYNVSEGTVRRWITMTRKGKLDIQLYERDGKSHVANTLKNKRTLEGLSAKSSKEGSARWHKEAIPKSEFYELFSKEQIVDIISNIDIHREIPLQYDYIGAGANAWDAYAMRLWEDEDNTLTATVDLLQAITGRLDRMMEDYDKINVIDIGVGNALPAKEFLTHLMYETGTLERYIALDISSEMLELAKKNIEEWFEGNIKFEGHVRDISFQRFHDLSANDDTSKTLNVVLLLGGTINNFRAPNEALRTIYHSMGRNDLFITSRKLDSKEARRSFDFSTDPDLPNPRHTRVLLDLLNLDESYYDVEQLYDENQRLRVVRLRFKVDVTISFRINSNERPIIIRRGETLVVWLARHQSALDALAQLENNDFELAEASISDNQKFLLTISRISPKAGLPLN